MIPHHDSPEADDSSEAHVTLQVGVKLLCLDQDQRLLLLRRNKSKYPMTGEEWDFAGGRIQPGEALVTALRREVTEETSLTVDPSPTLVLAQDIFDIPGRHVVRLTYRGSAVGSVVLDEVEHIDYGWFRSSAIRSLSGNGGLNKYCLDALSAIGWTNVY
jgi:8-oxo-dGTP pyrophosphatase MutT (NUDIX family)